MNCGSPCDLASFSSPVFGLKKHACTKTSFPLYPVLQETLHKHHKNNETNSDLEIDSQHLETASCNSDAKEGAEKFERTKTSKESLFRNWPLMSSIIIYCVVSLQDTAYSEVLYASNYG